MTHQESARDHDRFLSLAEVGERLSLSRWRLMELIQAGELAAIKTGPARNSSYRISEAALADFIQRNTVRPAAKA
jgi:excisionase family DNA binding protein